jgi:hypothetical protein
MTVNTLDKWRDMQAELERRADEIERLRQALMQIANPVGLASRHDATDAFNREFSVQAREIARAALSSG